ncbi:UNVERIFIED_CONTAM: Topless-related protein 1 [Sesamum angustifolium]|uniref:Topless-related protein 1 n=1 Tax=Sesamum angustifolium TaxID=2727405 RepID=A0AAW2JBT0_9LAMI
MSLCKDLIFLILQFCDEENLKRTAHMLEQETGYFFDLKYFEELLLNGNCEEAEKYLSNFTVVEDNKYSTKIYFEIRKQKFLEALDKHEHAVALDILLKDLKVFAQSNKELYKEMTQLLVLDDFREHSLLTFYGDTLSARKRMIQELRTVIEANPLLQGRTRFPQINKSRLRRLINQSLNWQHIHCAHPHPQPHIDTLFTDHKCPGPDNMQDQLNKESSLPPTSAPLSVPSFMGNSTSDQSTVTESLSTATPCVTKICNAHLVAPALEDNKNGHDSSNLKSPKSLDEVASSTEFSSRCQDSANELPVDFPRTLERILNVGSTPTTMDFHPVHETLLLVGKSDGDIELWNVTSAEKLFKSEFRFFDVKSASGVVLEDMEKNPGISVRRVLWSPDGLLFGVAYSRHMIRLYLYHKSANYVEKKLEIDAHVGSVNDLAFSKPHDKVVLVSCGDDKLIQVWDAVTGSKQYTFEGHEAPVYSVCPHVKENVHFLFSISKRGEIKAWLFDNLGSRVTYDSPGFCCMRMAYSADGKRLFSCGTNENGESYIVEWNETEGFIIRNYHGLSKCSSAMVQFDTSSNRFLAAGDEHFIKIWDMNNAEILAVIDADGGLPENPYICFNKNGNLLAVSADDNQIKILANDHGRELLQTSDFVSGDSSGCLTESLRKLYVNPIPGPLKAVVERGDATTEEALDVLEKGNPRGPAESTKVEMPNISKIVEVSRCQSVLLTSEVKTNLIRRLVYTHAGNGILALAEDGTHLLWRWVKSDANLSGEATTRCAPQLWQPKSGLLMINDLPENSLDVVTPCFSLSRNDSYVVSASGRMVSLYNMLIFKKLRNVMPAPPAATCIVFYPPDNNIIAIGMDDSTILIYNIRVDEVISKLQGHSKRITGLAFSTTLNVLVSCGVDTQIVLWDSGTWEKKKSTVLQISVGWLASELSETNIELEKDQKHFLAVHETQLAIYETTTLRRVKQWTIANFCTRISHATYSCDSQWVYAAMRDGILLILDASDLAPRFEIDQSAYLPPRLSCYVDPVVVAAHPQKPHQFALGLSNGGVVVIEPLESEGRWSAIRPLEEN